MLKSFGITEKKEKQIKVSAREFPQELLQVGRNYKTECGECTVNG